MFAPGPASAEPANEVHPKMNQSPTDPPFFETVFRQRACRELSSEPIPEPLIERMLKAGTHAPSSRNSQPWRFVVVQDPLVRGQVADCARAAWEAFARAGAEDPGDATFQAVDRWAMGGLGDAPLIIVVCGDTTVCSMEEMGSSVYLAAQNILLAATALGLGSLMSSLPIFAPGGAFRAALELPVSVVPFATLPIGYPARKLGRPRRIPVEELASRDRFGVGW